jgi:dTDP-4-amino-4,6-dideoxygalactose transaminase
MSLMSFGVLVDVNVFEDVIRKASGWTECERIIQQVGNGGIDGWISSLTKPLLYSFCVKELGEDRARRVVHDLTLPFAEIPLRSGINRAALVSPLPAYTDGVQLESARQFHLDGIITRHTINYRDAGIPVYTPEEFMALSGEGTAVGGDATVPFLDLKAQHHKTYNDIDDRIADISTNTAFILGKYVEDFEERFAGLHKAKYCLGVSSGTDALHIALMVLGIGPGDAVIAPVSTFMATAEAISLCGAVPLFVDCGEYHNLDVRKTRLLLEGLGTGGKRQPYAVAKGLQVKAVIPVHLYGQPADMDAVMELAAEFGLKVVEDCCQAHLARWDGKEVGSFGAFGAFSFYPGKNLGAYGEAGALVTSDSELYTRARMVRQHGEIQRYHHETIGHNYRMEAIQGAVLASKLGHLAMWTEKRRANAELYNELLRDVEEFQIPLDHPKCYSVYHLYVVQIDNRSGLQNYLQENGIGTGLHYPVPLHLQPAYAFLGYREGDFPVAENAAKRILSLPMYPELTESQVRYVAHKIKEFLVRKGK